METANDSSESSHETITDDRDYLHDRPPVAARSLYKRSYPQRPRVSRMLSSAESTVSSSSSADTEDRRKPVGHSTSYPVPGTWAFPDNVSEVTSGETSAASTGTFTVPSLLADDPVRPSRAARLTEKSIFTNPRDLPKTFSSSSRSSSAASSATTEALRRSDVGSARSSQYSGRRYAPGTVRPHRSEGSSTSSDRTADPQSTTVTDSRSERSDGTWVAEEDVTERSGYDSASARSRWDSSSALSGWESSSGRNQGYWGSSQGSERSRSWSGRREPEDASDATSSRGSFRRHSRAPGFHW